MFYTVRFTWTRQAYLCWGGVFQVVNGMTSDATDSINKWQAWLSDVPVFSKLGTLDILR